jgi:hypothetical protein
MATVSSVRFRVAPGKNQEAIAYLHKVAAHLKGVTGADYRIFSQVAGPIGHMMIASTWDSVAAWDAGRQKQVAEAGFQKLANDAATAGLWIAGSIEAAVWEEV